MSRAPDITGHRFGRLVVVSRRENNADGQSRWECICDCGNACVRPAGQLRLFQKRGVDQSCGCRRDALARERRKAAKTHGLTSEDFVNRKLYDVWKQMLRRCDNPRCKDYPAYGFRGISICKAWRDPNEFE